MNEELKIKIWDKTNKCYITDSKGKLNEYVLFIFYDDIIEIEAKEGFVIQRGTVCTDKDRKEIYEGDILSYMDKIGFVELIAGSFYCTWDDQTENELGLMGIDQMSIIGNDCKTPITEYWNKKNR